MVCAHMPFPFGASVFMNACATRVTHLVRRFLRVPSRFRGAIRQFSWSRAGQMCAMNYEDLGEPQHDAAAHHGNPLSQLCSSYREGPGIWKWRHYFDIYHHHLAKFIGTEVAFAEVGVFSGGSLRMWKSYFGERCRIHGVDLDEATRAYHADHVSIHIGDQEDRAFWRQFRRDVPALDVIVDDGGHTPEQQRVTLEEMLPHLRPGGVYICEDIHSEGNAFSAYVAGLVDQLNSMHGTAEVAPTPFQSRIASIHCYPYVVVIEKRMYPLSRLCADRYGTEWQPPLVVRDGYGTLLGRGR